MTPAQDQTVAEYLRQRWIPTGAEAIERAGVAGVAYLYDGRALLTYRGRAVRPEANIRYRDEARARAAAAAFLDSVAAAEARRAAARRERVEYRHDYKVGDVLDGSWGYDQTNSEFYEVVQVRSPKTIVVREIAHETVAGSEGFMSERVMPRRGVYCGEPIEKRVQPGGRVKMRHYYLGRWDGSPAYSSWYA